MPHLSMEYSGNLDQRLDMAEFCAVMRDAMIATGVFPAGGVRVRAFRADAWAAAVDGAGFIDMSLRLGAGRSLDTRRETVETLYAAAEAWLKPRVGDMPFALSFEMREIDPDLKRIRFNTIHDHVSKSQG